MAVKLDILAQISGLAESNKELAKFAKDAEKSLGGLEDQFDSLKKIAVVVAGAFAFKELIHAAVESEQAILRLNTSLKLSGDFSKETSNSFQELADSLERTANIDENLTLSLVAQGKALGFTNDETQKLVKTSADVAAVLGTDVNTAFSELSRTLNGQVGRELAKRFPEFKRLSFEALTNGEVIKSLGDRYKGAAVALSQDFGGALKGVTIAFEDVVKNTGKIITSNPALITSFFALRDSLFTFADNIKKASEEGSSFTGLVNLAASAITGLANIIRNIDINTLATGIRLGAEALVAFTVATKAGEFVSFASNLKSVVKGLNEVERAALGATIKANILKASLTFGATLLIDQIISGFTEFENLSDAIVSKFNSIKSVVLDVFAVIVSGIGKLTALLQKLPGGSKLISDDAVRSIQDISKGLSQSANESSKVASALKSINKEQKTSADQLKNSANKASDARKKNLNDEKKLLDLQFKDKSKGLTSKAASNPFESILSLEDDLFKLRKEGATKEQLAVIKTNAQIGQGVGLFSEVLQGAQGASKALSQGLGAIAESFIPGIGGAVSQIVEVFAKGPEFVKQQVTAFVETIPLLIQNIAESIPVVIDALIQKIPDLVEKLAQLLPSIAIRFALSLSNQAPFIATRFAIEIIKNIPSIVSALVNGVIDGIKGAFSSLGGIFGGGGDGGILGSVGSVFGFASGGTPSFSGGDNLLAGFNAKELVVDKTDTQRLGRFLDKQDSGQGLAAINSRLERLEQNGAQGRAASQPIIVQSVIDRTVLASAMFNLRMDGFRV